MFPTCISFLDIQSWWEVPSIAHFCSLFRTTFNLLDFDIEDLEEALLADGTEETSWLQELIVLLLKGCQPRNEISVSNYQMFLRRLFRRKCQQHNITNPFNTDIDFQLLPLRAKVVILKTLCDFRLDAADVIGQLRKLEADSLRVEPLGYDSNKSAYWYFYGTRLYREDKPKSKHPIWQVVCFTLNDWTQLAKKFENSKCRAECQLSCTLNENFLPELPNLFDEKESLARKRLIERLPTRSSNRLKNKVEEDQLLQQKGLTSQEVYDEESRWIIEPATKHHEETIREHRSKTYERLRRRDSRQLREHVESDFSDDGRYEMAGAKGKDKKTKGSPKQKKDDGRDVSSRRSGSAVGNKNAKGNDGKDSKPVGRQTNNSLASATGQILIQPVSNPHRKKMKTSQVFSQSEEDLQTGLHKILDHVKNHDDAWPFIEPVEEEYAPNYYSIIRKPMDLQSMEDRLDSGHYKTYSKFKTDFQLIVDNCRLYNGADNEYTEMVDNLLEVFNSAVEKYLEQITSSDEEIAVEYPNVDKDKANKKKKTEVVVSGTKRKPSLAVQPDRKKERSPSEESLHSIEDKMEVDEIKVNKTVKKTGKGPGRGRGRKPREVPLEEKETKFKKTETKSNKKLDLVKVKEAKKDDKSKSKQEDKVKKNDKAVKDNDKRKLDEKTEKVDKIKKVKKCESPKSKKPEPDKTKKCQVDEVKGKKDLKSKKTVNAKVKKPDQEEEINKAKSTAANKKSDKKVIAAKPKIEEKNKVAKKRKRSPSPSSPERRKSKSPTKDPQSVSPPPSCPSSPENIPNKKDIAIKDDENKLDKNKGQGDSSKETINEEKGKKAENEIPKDKHNKLRETIEKLKAKSDMTKLNNDMKVFEFESEKPKDIKKDHVEVKKKPKISKKDDYEDGNSTADSAQSDKKSKKKGGNNSKPLEYDALNLATEQTLKDINKWLDSSPSFTSASNSPSHFGDEVDPIKNCVEIDKKKVEKPVVPKKDVGKDTKKRPFSRENKRRKEVQRTIDRLQPGKSKGNLISNVQSAAKTDDIFPLGPLSKIKDTKNSLIVRTDDSAPKLSLGSVLDSFGEHKFVDDEIKEKEEDSKKTDVSTDDEKKTGENSVERESVKDEAKLEPIKLDNSPGVATPNLSAWFKAFGAPKVQPSTTKKPEKEEKIEEVKKEEVKKVLVAEPSPNSDNLVMQVGQPIARQRKVSTGSSISERSSFSQDMDSPRVGIDERIGAYPAPYPSPLHKSPSGASPNLQSPRPDISPKYNFNNGQIRVGFYQDTVSTKSSPEKSCSPRDNPQSPYSQYGEMYPNNQNYSYTNPYYPPNYSTSNPTPPYNNEQSNQGYYDQTKSVNSPVNSPVAHSPINQQDSPTINQPQQSPSLSQQNSPSVDSYQQNSPNMDILSMEGGYQRQNQTQMPSPNYNNNNRQGQQQQGMAIQHKQNIQEAQAVTHQQISPKYQQQENMQLHVPKIDHIAMQPQEPQQEQHLSRQMAQMQQTMFTQQQQHRHSMVHPQQQQQQQQQTPPSQPQNELYALNNYRNSQALDPNYRQSPQMVNESQQQQHIVKQQNAPAPPPTAFPVKKRAYSEMEQFQEQRFTTPNIETPGIMANRLEPVNATEQVQGAKYVHQNIPEPRSMPNSQMIQNQSTTGVILNTGGPQQDNTGLRNFSPTVSNPYNYNAESYPLNIPSRSLQQERKSTDLSKFADVQQARKSADLTKFAELPAYNTAAGMDFTRNTTQFNKPELNFTKGSLQNVQTSEQPIRFSEAPTNMINYKTSQAPNQPTSLSEVSIPRPTYSAPSTLEMDLRGNLANLSHIVERYPNDERVLPGLQSGAPPAYNMTPAQHMFKANPSMFTQPNSMPTYTHNIQTNTMYNRPMSEIQGPAPVSMMGQDRNSGGNTPTLQQQMQEKKTKRRKTTKTVNPPSTVMETNPTAVSTQGFQSYKNPGSMEPSAISLKTASVPGSAFNFGPTAPGLGLATGLTDAYPNYLEDFRAAPQLLYTHHRTTPTEGGTEKPTANVRTAHQSTNPQPPAPGYTFLGAPQPRPGYPPLPGHFMPPHHQGTLMDASSPLYQQYLQAGVLHQGLLGPSGYPPGYISIRQPYDPMSRSFY